MKKFIITNPTTGEILSVQDLAWENQLTEGLTDDGSFFVKEVSLDQDTTELLRDYYYGFEEGGLVRHTSPKPSNYHNWSGSAWEKDTERFLSAIKGVRNQRLIASDWTQMPDSPLTTEQKAAWATYRQALRDLPANLTGSENTLEDAPWPTPPSEGS